MSARFKRLAETNRDTLSFSINGKAATALVGDTLLVELLQQSNRVRSSEFGDGERAGFCLMGACQDCWVRTADGVRLRACTTPVEADMQIVTTPLEATWSDQI